MAEPDTDLTDSIESSNSAELSGGRHPSMPPEDLITCLMLFLGTMAVFFGVWRCAFVNFDDTVYVTENVYLRGGMTPATLKWILFSFQPDNWFPVTRLSHLIDYTLFGYDSAFHHGVSLLIHACATVLLYGFLRSAWNVAAPVVTAGEGPAPVFRGPAEFIAFLFAIHPLHVESVAWVSERKDVLCALFWFAALWMWVEWVKRPSRGRYYLALALFGLGLMSKPMIVTLPVLLLLLDIWPLRRRTSLADCFSRESIAEKLPFAALSFGAAALTWLAQTRSGSIKPLGLYGAGMRVENALITPWIYIGKTLWPVKLSAIYPWPLAFPLWEAVAGGLGLIAVSWFVAANLQRRPWLAVGWFWLLVTLLPVIGIVQVGEQVRADRYMYVPMVGLGLMAAGSAAELIARSPQLGRAMTVLACAILIALSLATWRQVGYWRDTETLFAHAVSEDPQNYAAWYILGKTRLNVPGQQNEAMEAFEESIRARPDFVQARDRLAATLCDAGRSVEGLREFDAVLRMKPDYAIAWYDMGNALASLGRDAEAIPRFREAARLYPKFEGAELNLGVALEKVGIEKLEREKSGGNGADVSLPGEIGDAVDQFQAAIRLNPGNPLSRYNLGTALMQTPNGLPEAIRQFREAVRLDPSYAAAHFDLGNALLKSPESVAEGLAELEEAERLHPVTGLRERLDKLEQSRDADKDAR